ncbi:MAG: hypothetical protein ABI852_01355 [Gemmatimonadaceae bacterium]
MKRGVSNRTRAATRWLLPAVVLLLASCAGSDTAQDHAKRGLEFKTKEQYPEALEEFNKALAKSPEEAEILNSRALIYAITHQFDLALKDFDHAITMNPNYALAIKNRGRVHFYVGNYREAADDMRKGGAVDPKNLYVGIWQYLAQQRLGEDGMSELAAGMQRADSTAWPMPIAKFINGTFTEAQLDSAALLSNTTAPQPNLCHAFYPAEHALVKHDTALARTRYDAVEKHCVKTSTEYLATVEQLSRLGGGAGTVAK